MVIGFGHVTPLICVKRKPDTTLLPQGAAILSALNRLQGNYHY